MATIIALLDDHETVRFAGDELARHLRLAGLKDVKVVLDDAPKAAFRIGVAGDVGARLPAKLDLQDDFVLIKQNDPKSRCYTLTGNNPRSVLFAVYRYLRELGFRWIRPGKTGQITPKLKSHFKKGIEIAERASYRYRTICIEGSTSITHVIDLIDWMAKHGMNGYFIQFHYGTIFFKRWYEHRGSKYMKPETMNGEMLAAGVDKIVSEITKRSMRFERMGHGWTCAALGIDGEGGWDKTDTKTLPADKVDWLAEVNGKKEFWGGVALNTNLNYGNPAVRAAVTDAIVDYARKNPNVNLLHFWLADGCNNHDERPESAAARPSDFFVDMLNELDEKLTVLGLSTRIVFLIYVDLLWEPTRAVIKNQSRFTLMFAPITRTYLRAFTDPDKSSEQPTPFVRNKLTMPKSARVNLHYLKQWQQMFRGDGFDFDYHLIWACYYDISMMTMARTLYRDIRGLKSIGLHGLNSVQNMRMSFPTNFCMDVMARTLWNRNAKFEDLLKESFTDAFGRDGLKVAAALDVISKIWLPFFEAVYIPERDGKRIDAGLKTLAQIDKPITELRKLITTNRKKSVGAIKESWSILSHHCDLLNLLAPAMLAYLKAEPDAADKLEKVRDWAFKNEPRLHHVLDTFEFATVIGWRVHEVKSYISQSKTGQTGVF